MKQFIAFIVCLLIVGSLPGQSHKEFHNVDSMVLSWNLTNYHDADELADTLVSAFDNDSEKVRAIYFWVTQYISYDLNKYKQNNDIAEEVSHDFDKDGNLDNNKMIKHTLIRKKGVCQDYADLFAYLCNYSKIKCESVSGLATGPIVHWLLPLVGGGVGHAWNAVMINSKWYLLDATWASGTIDGNKFRRQRNDFYYLTPPEEFIKEHFPYDNQWQLLNPPVDKKTYLKLAK